MGCRRSMHFAHKAYFKVACPSESWNRDANYIEALAHKLEIDRIYRIDKMEW